MFKKLLYQVLPNPLDQKLRRCLKEKKKRFLIPWNRGLGDVPLGLYALCAHIKKFIPHAEITFLTRQDLHEVFEMLEGVDVLSSSSIKRGKPFEVRLVIESLGLLEKDFDVILENIDSDRWLSWQIGKLTPMLNFKKEDDSLYQKFGIESCLCLGVHVSTQTGNFYDYQKNWPPELFQKLFDQVKDKKILLFGFEDSQKYIGDHIIDLRGKTTLFEMISIIKNCCSHLLAPDSGVLNIIYYLKQSFPLKVVSLWSDPRQGLLKQKVASPNKELLHIPLIGKNENVSNLSFQKVFNALFTK